jgi:hypothetical protein
MSRARIASAVTFVIAAVATIAVVGLQQSSTPTTSAIAAENAALSRYMPGTGAGESGENLDGVESYWSNRLTYPTGDFNADWIRRAAAQAARVPTAAAVAAHQVNGSAAPVKAGAADGGVVTGSGTTSSFNSSSAEAPVAAPSAPFVSLGPKPLIMTGCSGCFNYTSTEGRINDLAIDPTTTTNGSITAYAASVGGGVWKTTTCCVPATTWFNATDDPLLSTISIDAVEIDPTNHDTIYAGTGDLNFGSFSMGSQGVLKSTDSGEHWTVLAPGVFGAAYSEPAGQFPQYQAVGKVKVDPRNGDNVVVGTKKGLYFSYDGGTNWAGPCLTNTYTTQRQDITGLDLSEMSDGTTRVVAAVGTRGFASTVQYDLGSNGANGIYKATMPTAGCPTFTSITTNANFVFGTAVSGTPYTTGASLNATSGTVYGGVGTGNQLGRIDIGVAPSNPDVIYAQVQSIAVNPNPTGVPSGSGGGCGGANGCQLGVFATTDGGTTWSMMAGSAGGSLRDCNNARGDYPQNWYDQAVSVDPNNPDRVLIDTFDIWLAHRTGTTLTNLSCGYSYTGPAGPVHTDQHAIAFVPGSSSTVLFGNDGGLRASINVDTASSVPLVRPTFYDVNTGLNTIEFYSGDISANFATSPAPQANGGAQDNGSSSVTFAGYPTGPAQWQTGKGGDGFTARIDPVSGAFFQGNNSGHIHRCTVNCTAPGAGWTDITPNAMLADQQSFVLPYEVFKGTPGNPGGQPSTDCSATTCNHIASGTVRVWETVNALGILGNGASRTANWYANSPANLTKASLGNRSYINQLAYSPATSSLVIVGTNDGNVQIGRNMGTGSNQSSWTNVTGGNAVLPNRPVLDVAFDPRSMDTAAAPAIGYAAVGGFDANTPSNPGHVFRVTCDVNCASSTWEDKTGNLPDIPVDSIVANPKFPQQVFAGTDFGLYVTDDVTVATPTWYRLQNGMPNVMIWDMQIDRGSTTLSLWTRSRGAYVWPLPSKRLVKLNQTVAFAPLPDRVWKDTDFGVAASASSGLTVAFAASGNCTLAGSTVHITSAGSCSVTASQTGDADTWNAAPEVVQTFAISKADQSINVGTAEPKRFGDADFQLEATATSELAVSLAVVSGHCTLAGATAPSIVHITGAGECVVKASQPGDGNWNAAEDVSRTFEIGKADQSIAFGELGDRTWGDSDVDLAATASSGQAVSYLSSGDCTVAGATVHITGAGSCTVTASQIGSDDYNPAPDVSRTFAIAKASQSLTFAALGNKTYGDGDFSLEATSSSGLLVSYGAVGTCTVTAALVHIAGAGPCEITATQGGDGNYEPATDVAQSFTIAQAPQSIEFDSIDDKTLGDADFTIKPKVAAGLPVYVIVDSGRCSVDSPTAPAVVHILGAGSCSITATQAGDADHAPATAVTRTFAIGKGSQTITFAPLPARVFGGSFSVAATSSSGLALSFTGAGGACTVAGSVVTLTGTGTCTVTAAQPGSVDYNPATSVSRTFQVVSSTTGTAEGKDLEPKTGGSADFEITANARGPRSLTGDLSYSGPRVKGSFQRTFEADRITAFGIAADGVSAWIAGVGEDGRRFTAYVENSTVKPKKRRPNGDLFQLWIAGVLQTGDGALGRGNVTIGTSSRH